MPRTPDVLNKIRLPELDFVEVYNQPPRLEGYDGDGGIGSVSRRYSRPFIQDLCTLFGFVPFYSLLLSSIRHSACYYC